MFRSKVFTFVFAAFMGCVAFGVVWWTIGYANDAHQPMHSSSAENSYSALIAQLTHHTVSVVKMVPTSVNGLTAIITRDASGKRGLVFGVGGDYLVTGTIIGKGHTILNETVAEQQGLVMKPMEASLMARKMMSAKGFILGHAGPKIAVFLDPNCIFCHMFYEDVLPELNDGKLRIKVVPVGFLKPSSLPKAVRIMESKNPAKAWAFNEAHFNVHTEEGGIQPAKNVHTSVADEIDSNTRLLSHAGGVATPTIAYCNKSVHPMIVQGAQTSVLNVIRSGSIASLTSTGECHG